MSTDLHLVEYFWTIQGEGANAGWNALFVRMPFCNLQCPWCDTEFNKFEKVSEKVFRDYANQRTGSHLKPLAVITGGEPTLHKHTPRVIGILKKLGFFISMESNGTATPPFGVDWLTVSPKRFQKDPYFINPDALSNASEFKYVVDQEFDFKVLDRHKASPIGPHLFLSPEWSGFRDNLQRIIEYTAHNPEWRVSLQTHKFMGVR